MNESRGAGARTVRIIGDGRAGGSFARVLQRHGWQVEVRRGGDDLRDAAVGVDVVLICVPDDAVGSVAASIEPVATTVVAHCAGSLGLDVLEPHLRRAGVHPLVSLPSPELGAEHLEGAWYGTSGDPLVLEVVDAVGGRRFDVADEDRAAYHAAAVVASNHLVALMGQVDRIARDIDVPPEAFLALSSGSLDNVAAIGPVAALTGPVARGDWATVGRHLDALAPDERPAYLALVHEAARLAGRDVPDLGS